VTSPSRGRKNERPDAVQPADGQAKFLAETETVTGRVADAVSDAVETGHLPLVLGGDHSIAIGSVAGAADGDDLGLLWFDAHGDFNTPETTPSGNVHGMSLAAILGVGPFEDASWAVTPEIDPANVALVGLRDLDDAEKGLIRESDVTAYTMSDIDDRGLRTSLTTPSPSPRRGPTASTSTSIWTGSTRRRPPASARRSAAASPYREAHVAMEYVADVGDQLRSFGAVEVNPILDQHNQTAELGCELVASAFGKRIL